MCISVWRASFTGKYREIDSGLSIRLINGRPRVSLPGLRELPVSDELAEIVIGARKIPCPNVGKEPAYGFFNLSEFKASDTIEESEFPGFVHCSRCGYSGHLGVNPRFAAALGNGPGSGEVHPATTYWTAEQGVGVVYDAGWDGKKLALGSDNSKLVVWLCGIHFKKNGAKEAAMKAFPRAEILHEAPGLYLLKV